MELGPTTTKGTAITKALVLGGQGSLVDSSAIPGIAYHYGVVFEVPLSIPLAPPGGRLRRVGLFRWLRAPTSDECSLMSSAACDWGGPGEGHSGSIDDRLRRWHVRAEAALRAASALGVCSLVHGERPKGSVPEARPRAPSAPHRVPQTIAVRRLLRFHRRLVHCARRSGPLGAPPGRLRRQWEVAAAAGLLPAWPASPDAGTLLDAVTSSLRAIAQAEGRQAISAWRQKIVAWGPQTAAAAARVMRDPAPAPAFSPDDMREEWQPIWEPSVPPERPRPGAFAEAALSWGFPRKPPDPGWVPPSFEVFADAIGEVSGAAGLDGWEASELQGLLLHLPCLVRELHGLLVDVLRDPAPWSPYRLQAVGALRVAGIPKRGTTASRPIAIAAVWVRAFSSCLLKTLPAPPAGAFGETGAVPSTAAWAAAPETRGPKLILLRRSIL